MNPFGDPPYPAQRLEPMKKMLLQELGNLVIIVKLSTALLQMLNPVQTGILDFLFVLNNSTILIVKVSFGFGVGDYFVLYEFDKSDQG
jgi:hypothetical protein